MLAFPSPGTHELHVARCGQQQDARATTCISRLQHAPSATLPSRYARHDQARVVSFLTSQDEHVLHRCVLHVAEHDLHILAGIRELVSYSLPRSLTRAGLTCMLLACTTGLYRCTHEQAQPLTHAIRHDLHILLAHASKPTCICDTHTRQYALHSSLAQATTCHPHLWPACASN